MAKLRRYVFKYPSVSYSLHVVGGPRASFRDAYHTLLRMPWWSAFFLIVGGFLILNAAFAGIFLWVGGISNARPGNFLDAFFFSVQTMGTIGYGTMFPQSTAANVVVVAESVVGLVVTALATGIVFVRFSQVRGRVVFAEKAAIGPMDGVPTLMIRLGNERTNIIYDAELRVTFVRTRRTKEGNVIYESKELDLLRARAPNLSQSWNILHRVDKSSPLHGETPESLAAAEAELMVAMSGTDQTSLQPIHGRYTYEHTRIAWGQRLADVLSELPNGDMQIDLTRFHLLEPTQPIAGFPYPPA
jgi:inward rectifier potassium channel